MKPSPVSSADVAELLDAYSRMGAVVARITGGAALVSPVASVATGNVTIAEAVKIVGVQRTKINELLASGVLVRAKIGRRALVTRASIERLLADSVVQS